MEMSKPPVVSVGILSGVDAVRFELKGEFVSAQGDPVAAGAYRAFSNGDRIAIEPDGGGPVGFSAGDQFNPLDAGSSFVLRDVVIGVDFHWQRIQDQEFQGSLRIVPDADGRLVVINEIDVESYLSSVISSEMSATARPDLLKAHACISRSWLLAQLSEWKPTALTAVPGENAKPGEIIRWYDRENHSDFDVCADDHCQRYQGITKATTQAVFEAVDETRGLVLRYDGELCDARFSKSCGGMTESFDAAWADVRIPYLAVSYDGEGFPEGFALPLTSEVNAERWIRGAPPAFCNTNDADVIRRILPDFDQETADFFRWRVTIDQEELQETLRLKMGIDFGPILALEPVERGESSRLIRLRIVGLSGSAVIGKELEIRRALSKSHLFSSAFVIDTVVSGEGIPERFILTGAGWGHGVGLCQIGAALMAEKGYNYIQILKHYYHHAILERLYPGS